MRLSLSTAGASLPLSQADLRRQAHPQRHFHCRPRSLRRLSCALTALLALLVLYILSSGIPASYHDVRAYERHLPQHNLTHALEEATPYLHISHTVTGRGLNNVLQETILLSYLAHRLQRAYVFTDYTWSRRSVPFVVDGLALRPARIPLNAFIAGPTAGGPTSVHRAVSVEFWEEVCPPARRRVVSSLGQPSDADGAALMDCLFGSPRLLTLWSEFSNSPILKDYTWSPLVFSALAKSTTDTTAPGLVAIHLRRGDFAGHCKYLARFRAQYMGFNLLPSLPDKFSPQSPHDDSDAARAAHYMAHCLPSVPEIVARLHAVRATHPGLRRVYVLTNGRRAFVRELERALQEDGWGEVESSVELEGRLSAEERGVAGAVDMALAERAEVFVGNGFSSLTSNVVMLRMARGVNPDTIRFL